MNSIYITIISGIAALLSAIGLVPQAIKIIRNHYTSGISAGMYIVTVRAAESVAPYRIE